MNTVVKISTELVAEAERCKIKITEIQAEPSREHVGDTKGPKTQRCSAQHQGVLPVEESGGRRSREEAARRGRDVESWLEEITACGPDKKDAQVPAAALALRLRQPAVGFS